MRNRFHSICPYFAMFPESFVRKNLVWAPRGSVVLDPYSGRGTTVFESLLAGRVAIGGDRNPVAFCLSAAKADPPPLRRVLSRLDELREEFDAAMPEERKPERSEFFRLCFATQVREQTAFLRRRLNWRKSKTDRMIAALALGALHGESHRSELYFSNRMPRTISTKPAYSVRWWKARKLSPPTRDAFAVIKRVAEFRYVSPTPERPGQVVHSDVRRLGSRLAAYEGKAGLIITSPPYLDVTNYHEDQWLRLWFLGGPAKPENTSEASDDRHRSIEAYRNFLTEGWRGISNLLAPRATFVVRIGLKGATKDAAAQLVSKSVADGVNRRVRIQECTESEIVNGQVHAFRPGLRDKRYEFDIRLTVR